ncbi:MAG: hypothetical protein ACLR4X_09695 [Clostridia bacterium]
MQVTMTMEEYTKLITANAKQGEQLNKMMEKYNNISKERYQLLKSQNNNEGCEFCKGKKEFTLKKGLDIGLSNNKLDFYFAACACGYFEDDFKINYCPMCGKKLEV